MTGNGDGAHLNLAWPEVMDGLLDSLAPDLADELVLSLLYLLGSKGLLRSNLAEVAGVEGLFFHLVELLLVLEIILVHQCSSAEVKLLALILQVQRLSFLAEAGAAHFSKVGDLVHVQVVLHAVLLHLAQVELYLAEANQDVAHKDLSSWIVVLVHVSGGQLEVQQDRSCDSHSLGHLIHVQAVDRR